MPENHGHRSCSDYVSNSLLRTQARVPPRTNQNHVVTLYNVMHVSVRKKYDDVVLHENHLSGSDYNSSVQCNKIRDKGACPSLTRNDT